MWNYFILIQYLPDDNNLLSLLMSAVCVFSIGDTILIKRTSIPNDNSQYCISVLTDFSSVNYLGVSYFN